MHRGGKAHILTHKIVKNGQSLKCHHVKRLSPTGVKFNTHCNESYIKLYSSFIKKYLIGAHIVKIPGD